MKLGILSYLALFANSISSQSTNHDQDKPLHIAVSMGWATRSHMKYLLEILELVSPRGHRITYLSTNEYKHFGDEYNVTHYSLGEEAMKTADIWDILPFTSNIPLIKGLVATIPAFVGVYTEAFPVYEKFYKEDKPDLMICDFVASGCIESALKNTIPLIIGYQSLMYSSYATYLSSISGLEPTTIEGYSFLQRFKHGIIQPIKLLREYLPGIGAYNDIRKKYNVPKDYAFPAFGHLGLGIANTFIGLENARKIPSHINLIGPILSEKSQELPEDLKVFLNDHPRVLYVAFGSVVALRPQLAENLLQHFQRAVNDGIVDGILWGGLGKTKSENFPKSFTLDGKEYSTQPMVDNAHDKIKFLKWAPQEVILNHPNTKLFLSHGGLDSVYESLAAGTPMLILPFLGDQPRNGILLTEHGIGDHIEWPTMGDEVIYQKFVKLLDPNNLELQSKVRQMQLIIKFSSKRKEMAADLIETYALSAKACRMYETPKPFEVPCEMKPYLPLDYKISYIKANLIDVYLVAILILCVVSFSFIYFIFKLISKYSKKLFKQKLE